MISLAKKISIQAQKTGCLLFIDQLLVDSATNIFDTTDASCKTSR
ncbi:hypothetical protein GLO73106DRAFT_00039750 [Gloeocapsa sp. PCC 73106]|nr:hypothetical protein GLO73106DRAFT_00039750 [Gloeocapsa sp. PCC 73106]